MRLKPHLRQSPTSLFVRVERTRFVAAYEPSWGSSPGVVSPADEPRLVELLTLLPVVQVSETRVTQNFMLFAKGTQFGVSRYPLMSGCENGFFRERKSHNQNKACLNIPCILAKV